MQLPLYTLEEEVFGLNHGTVGAIIAKKWNLPPTLVEAIEFHHHPLGAPKFQKLAAIVGFADCLCHMPCPHENDSEMQHLLEWSMNNSLAQVLKNIYGDISKEMIHANKVKAGQFLEENEKRFDLIPS